MQLITLKLNVVSFFYCMAERLVDWKWPAVGNVPVGANTTVAVTASLSLRSLLVVTVSCRRAAASCYTVIPRLTKIIRSGITFVSRNVISRWFL